MEDDDTGALDVLEELVADADGCDLAASLKPIASALSEYDFDSALKPGKLDADEWQIMKQHATHGGEINGDQDSELLRLAKTIALTHHEKWDCSGYPNGLKGESIRLEGRIIAIADVFDALTTARPYKKAWPVDKAVNLITEGAGAHLDPDLVPIFLNALPDILEIRDQYAEEKGVLLNRE